MVKGNRFHLLFISFALLFCSFNSIACYLTVQTIEYPPLAMKDEQGHWHGKNFEYLDLLFGRAKCEYRVIHTPHARGLKLMERGSLDMTVNVSKTPEREPYFHFIGPQRYEEIRLVSYKGRLPLIRKWQDFDNLDAKLVWQTGAYYGDKLKDALASNAILRSRIIYSAQNNDFSNIVNSGAADGFFVEATFLEYQQKLNPTYQNIEVHPLVINLEPVYFAFSKKSLSENDLKRFQKAFDEIQSSGELAAVQNP